MSGGAGYVFNLFALNAVTKMLSPTQKVINSKMCKSDSAQGMEDLELGEYLTN